MKKKLKYYVVWEGHKKGVYNSWEECKVQINNFKGAKYKSFGSLKDANNALSKIIKFIFLNQS
jgi:ribonuclease HI